MERKTLGVMIITAVVVGAGMYLYMGGAVPKGNITAGQYQTKQETTGVQQKVVKEKTIVKEKTKQENPQPLPQYQLSTVNRYLKDKMSPGEGVADIDIEVLVAPPKPRTYSDLAAIATNPERNTIDEDNTSTAGKVSFTAGAIKTGKPYIYSVRGDNTIYDKLVVDTIKAPSRQFKIDTYTFPSKDNIKGWRVGSFKDIHTDSDNVLTGSEYSELNVTANSGTTLFTTEITIGEKDSGKALRNAILAIDSKYLGKRLEGDEVKKLFITKKSGTEFNIPSKNLKKWIDGNAITLGGSKFDEVYGSYMMTAMDSGTYTLKLSYDADQVEPATDGFQIILDDLGSYLGTDDVTKSTKAPAETLEIDWQA